MANRGYSKQNSIIYQVPKVLEFLDEEDERRKCQEFKDDLVQFQRELGNDNFKVPSIGGKELDLCKLYKAVYVRGGSV
jgi:predicted secreted protein